MRAWFALIMVIYILVSWLIARQLHDLLRINVIAFTLIFSILAATPLLSRVGHFGLLELVGNYWLVFFYYAAIVAVLGIIIEYKPVLIGCYLLIIIIIIVGSVQAKKVQLVSYEIEIPKNAASLHAVLLSDTHINKTKGSGYVANMVEDINSLNPDIVFLAGDIFDDRDINVLRKEKETLKGIQTKYGVYGVVGNHEYYSNNLSESLAVYEEANIKILIDEVVQLESLYIAGRDDVHNKRKGLRELLQGVDKNKPIILLDHQPVSLAEAVDNSVDLQLSGHTHKGQFFPNQLFTKRIFEVDYGYLVKDSLQLIVTSGYSTWGPPVRIGTQSEIVDIHIDFVQ
ncbi:MAG: metallophosphoesterase [Desulfotomaculaceae bacterium]